MERPSFSVVFLPRALPDRLNWQLLISRYKDFRLHSLRTSPAVFGSTFERENNFGEDVWDGRLRNMRATNIVAIACNNHADSSDEPNRTPNALLHDWLGSIVLIEMEKSNQEPISRSALVLPRSRELETPAQLVLHFHINAVFVDPVARGRGIGAALVDEAVSFGVRTAAARGLQTAEFTLLVDDYNTEARRLYENAGFEEAQVDEDEIGFRSGDGPL
ncbi:hypothetical protein BDY21DRAFT_334258 [Lineolata rhizophorae]|uniref:N-acetyltransferase domain-containing protein n=1 Tax=Lineolata rhizophorae TaxID=578093 RepID=A0A6A6PAW1_9PEZI|nr:hypothetical protein BDY21DRAFT_334258 [Lineolata rhizophorae]